MSSWIPSLFNPFTDDDNPTSPEPSSPNNTNPKSPSSGAKDDLSAVFRGVAAFLAPPLTTSLSEPSSSSETISGIKNDLAEIQGSLRSGLSLISSKLTSNLMQFQNQFNDGEENDEVEEEEDEEDEEGEEEDGLGISEEVFDFVLRISRRPELWTDFPLSLPDDFNMSDYQREHAANIDHLVPEFATLRQNICSQISDQKFWLIYFILLLPRLGEEDLKLLSTPQVSEARETLLKKLRHKNDEEQVPSENPKTSDTNNVTDTSQHKDALPETASADKQTEIVNVTEPGHKSEEVDICLSNDAHKPSENEDDVSFSDLEDDDKDPSAPKVSKSNKAWVELGENSGSQDAKQKSDQYASTGKESEGEDSNDWLTVDGTDFDNLADI